MFTEIKNSLSQEKEPRARPWNWDWLTAIENDRELKKRGKENEVYNLQLKDHDYWAQSGRQNFQELQGRPI